MPSRFDRYYEPFIGGGALFFDVAPDRAVIGDRNPDLIATYRAVRDEPEGVIERLRSDESEYMRADEQERDRIYRERREQLRCEQARGEQSTTSDVERAACLIFVNHTCFNGVWRTNRAGLFNVPRGDQRKPTICDAQLLRACSQVLRGTTIVHDDFEAVVADARSGDFVYLDPPYVPISATSAFVGYVAEGFTDRDHVRVRDVAADLVRRGVHVIASNSAAPLALDLYADRNLFTVHRVKARRSIAANGNRTPADEIIVAGRTGRSR